MFLATVLANRPPPPGPTSSSFKGAQRGQGAGPRPQSCPGLSPGLSHYSLQGYLKAVFPGEKKINRLLTEVLHILFSSRLEILDKTSSPKWCGHS